MSVIEQPIMVCNDFGATFIGVVAYPGYDPESGAGEWVMGESPVVFNLTRTRMLGVGSYSDKDLVHLCTVGPLEDDAPATAVDIFVVHHVSVVFKVTPEAWAKWDALP